MSSERHAPATKLVATATLALFMIAQSTGAIAGQAKAKTTVKHKPLSHFVSGHRIRIEATIADPQDVTLARCYFRAAGQASYVFVGMSEGKKNMFSAILPAPSSETRVIDYLFLTVNGKNQVVKTQVFKTEQKDTKKIPDWQQVSGEGKVTVSTELSEATTPAGFTDSIATDVVESAVRFGYVAGIYSVAEMAAAGSAGAAAGGTAGAAAGGTTGAAAGGTTGSAAAATSSGTVSASAGGGGAAGTVLGVTAAVAVVGAAAVGVVLLVDALGCDSGSGTCSARSGQSCSGYMAGDLGCCSIDTCADYSGSGFYRTSDGNYYCWGTNASNISAAARAAVDHCKK